MLGLVLLAAALLAPPNPAVRVMIHIPLHGTRLGAYERELRQYGRITNHIGSGTWLAATDVNSRVVAEPVDHIELVTDLRTARSFLPAFLRRLRIEQHQVETLAEIFGGAYGTPQQTRTRIIVRLPAARATAERMLRLHRVFDDDGAGGDSMYVNANVVIDYSGVQPRAARRIEASLHRAHFTFSTEQETFITDDAKTR